VRRSSGGVRVSGKASLVPRAQSRAQSRPRGHAGETREGILVSGQIDFAEINRAALAAFPAVVARILPGGRRVGAIKDMKGLLHNG